MNNSSTKKAPKKRGEPSLCLHVSDNLAKNHLFLAIYRKALAPDFLHSTLYVFSKFYCTQYNWLSLPSATSLSGVVGSSYVDKMARSHNCKQCEGEKVQQSELLYSAAQQT